MIEPGFYPDMSPTEYHADRAMSSGKLKVLAQSPAHYLSSFGPNKPSKEMVFGSAVHTAILEPGRFSEQVVSAKKVSPADRQAAADSGISLINEEEAEAINGMKASFYSSDTARNLILASEHNEASVFWKERTYDFMCKCRPDILTPGMNIIADLKTCADGSPKEFYWAAIRYFYTVQSAWYLAGCNTIKPEWQFHHFIFICCEKTPPYAVSFYRATDERIVNPGREIIKSAIRDYADCLKTGFYPGYPDEILDL